MPKLTTPQTVAHLLQLDIHTLLASTSLLLGGKKYRNWKKGPNNSHIIIALDTGSTNWLISACRLLNCS